MTARTGRAGSAARAQRAGAAWGAGCGVLAAAVAMGIGQLLAGLSIPAASPVVAVGQAAIDLTPQPVKNWAISSFGADDKNVLLTGVVVVVFLYAIVVGILAMRRLSLGFAGLAVFAALGLAAALTRPGASAGYVLPTLGGAAVGAFALYRLVLAARGASGAAASSAAPASAEELPPIVFGDGRAAGDQLRPPDLPGEVVAPDLPGSNVPALRPQARPDGGPARRAFLYTAGVTVAVAAVAEYGGRQLATRHNVSAARTAIRFPRPADPAPPLPAGVSLPVRGISSFITPNSQFYRVDTALLVPEVDPSNWRLRIHGMVAREIDVTFAELLRRPLIEDYITLCCVSNPVGGPYIGNAKWLGASLASLLREARPRAGATQLLCTSADGFTSGTPLAVVLDGRDSLVAVAMNGAALPVNHGFPARLVVPGLYGYVSACKWVTDIEVTTFQAAAAYWIQRGWSQQGPIKTESRIDVPAGGSSVAAGRVTVAGVAWAQHKGIEAVEVRVDRGPWQTATLATVPGIDTWRQWVWQWEDAPSGTHLIEARATDKTGYTQTSVQEDVEPNGASGYPSAQITVR
jgi:DMSO/TMAO reductase YedYZ molybdopterin-dependent catalytic subunit